MTKRQLLGLYWESFRQEARERLKEINNLRLAQGGEKAKDALDEMEMQAFPFDPEADGDFGPTDIKQFKSIFGGAR